MIIGKYNDHIEKICNNSAKDQPKLNSRIQEVIDYWLDPKSNQSSLYAITKQNHWLRKNFGDYYIGPEKFVILKNASNEEMKFQIQDSEYNFEITTLIIPGITLDGVKIQKNCQKHEVSAAEFVYHEKDLFFLPYDCGFNASFLKNPFNEPQMGERKDLSKKVVKKLLEIFPESRDSMPNFPIIEIQENNELQKLFSIIKETFQIVTAL